MIHQIAFTSNTNTLYERFQTNPKGLIDYHE